jgi:hypothetical protein
MEVTVGSHSDFTATVPEIHLICGLVNTRAVMNSWDGRKVSCICREYNHIPLDIQPVASRGTGCNTATDAEEFANSELHSVSYPERSRKTRQIRRF